MVNTCLVLSNNSSSPVARKSVWLAGTALAAMVGASVGFMPQSAFAACDANTAGTTICTGSDASITKAATGDLSTVFVNQEVTTSGASVSGAWDLNFLIANQVGGVPVPTPDIVNNTGGDAVNVSSTGGVGNSEVYFFNGNVGFSGGAHIMGDDEGVQLFSNAGNVTFHNVGVIEGGDDGVRLVSGGDGTVAVTGTNYGDIIGGDDGVRIVTYNGANISFTNYGNITGTADDGIDAWTSGGNVSITNASTGSVSSFDDGIRVSSGGNGTTTVTVSNAGNIFAGDDGIRVRAYNGANIDVTNSGFIGGPFLGFAGDEGIHVWTSGGNILVTNTATGGILALDDGIRAISGGNGTTTVTVNNAGNILALDDAIRVRAYNGANIAVTNSGTADGGDEGVHVWTSGGNILVTNTSTGNIFGLDDGIRTVSGGNGTTTVNIENSGLVTGGDDGAKVIAYGSANILINNYATGNITGFGDEGVDAWTSGGNITLNNSGVIDGRGVGQDGARLVSGGNGTTTVAVYNTATGSITGDDDGLRIRAYNGANIYFENTGNITGTNDEGVHAWTSGGNITGYNYVGGNITGADDGVRLISGGNGSTLVYFNNAGNVSGGDDGVRVRAYNGANVTVINSGNIVGVGDDGVHAWTSGGNIQVTNQASGFIGSFDDGVRAISGGNSSTLVRVDNYGNIFGGDDGVRVRAYNGANIEVVNWEGGSITGVLDDGVHAWTSGGNISVWNNAGAFIGSLDDGVRAISGGNSSTLVYVNNAGNIVAGDDGVRVRAYNGANIESRNSGLIDAVGDDGMHLWSAGGNILAVNELGATILAADDGIRGWISGNGNISVFNYGSIGVVGDPVGGDGIFAGTSGTGSAYIVNDNLNSIHTAGNGINVVMPGGGDITIYNGDGNLPNPDGLIVAGLDGIRAWSNGGIINVFNGVSPGSLSDIQAGDDGIRARSEGGPVNVWNYGNIDSGLTTNNGYGIYARSAGGSGNVQVVNMNTVTGDDGVYARASGAGTGSAFVFNGDDGSTYNYNARITANGSDGDGVTIIKNGGASGDVGLVNYGEGWWYGNTGGIYAENGKAINIRNLSGGSTSIYNYGTVIGQGNFWDPVIQVAAASGATPYIYNGYDGVVASAALLSLDFAGAAGDHMLRAFGGGISLVNDGTMYGRMSLFTDTANVVSNYGYWGTTGISRFYGGPDDTLNNYNTIETAFDSSIDEYTEFRGLNYFNNFALLTMIDGWEGDTTYTTGDFNGYAGSTLALDTYLGAPGSRSDMLVVGGATNNFAGLSTAIYVNDTNYGSPGAFNPVGIPVVQVVSGNADLDNFYIDPYTANYSTRNINNATTGVIDKGLFFYALGAEDGYVDNNGVGYDGRTFVLYGLPDVEIFQLSKATTGAQNIWHETTGVWLDRQADLRNYLDNPNCVAGAGADLAVYKAAPPVCTVKAPTPGIWMKAVGAWTDRKNQDSTYTFANTNSVTPLSVKYNTDYKQNTFGIMGGIDFGRAGISNPNDAFLIGVMGGYLTSNLDFKADSNGFDYSGPTVGGYATYLNNGFFIDAIVKADLLKMKWNAPSLAGFYGYLGQEVNATSIGVTVDSGYKFKFGNGGFLEPLGTFSWVRTTIDGMNLLGNNINFADSDSVRLSGGARLGWLGMTGTATKAEASVTARYWYEFEDPGAVSVISYGWLVPGNFQDNMKGGFGDVNGTLSLISIGTGWSGFVNGGVKFNNDFTTISAKGGVRYNW